MARLMPMWSQGRSFPGGSAPRFGFDAPCGCAFSPPRRHLAKIVSLRYQIRMADSLDTTDRIAELLVRLGRVSRLGDGQTGLTSEQWTCLRFFARANAATRTPSAFASFQATTRGTASQVIKTLEGRGLIARSKSSTDGRSVRFDLTDAGRCLLSRDPLGDLNRLLATIDAAERRAFLDTLSRLSASLADLKNAGSFGTCRDCSHFTSSRGQGFCACLTAALSADDIDKLCASYRGPADLSPALQPERHSNDSD